MCNDMYWLHGRLAAWFTCVCVHGFCRPGIVDIFRQRSSLAGGGEKPYQNRFLSFSSPRSCEKPFGNGLGPLGVAKQILWNLCLPVGGAARNLLGTFFVCWRRRKLLHGNACRLLGIEKQVWQRVSSAHHRFCLIVGMIKLFLK